MFQQSVRSVLDQEKEIVIIDETNDGDKGIKLTDELLPDIILMYITSPKLDGVEATRRIKAAHPIIAGLVITIHTDDQMFWEVLKPGRAGAE